MNPHAIADTLEAQAEAGEPLAPREMKTLAQALRKLAPAPERVVSLRPALTVVEGGRV